MVTSVAEAALAPARNNNPTKADLLSKPVRHIDIKLWDATSLIDAMSNTAFQARNLARAAKIYVQMLEDTKCSIILCLAGSLISAGMKQVIVDLIDHNMVDAIVSTGANIVDQDFFEAIGFQHYQGENVPDDDQLQALAIDRIYDTLIDEDQLRICDHTIYQIADQLPPQSYSSREFIIEMGKYLDQHHSQVSSIILSCYRKQVPIFIPAFSDCSAGFGLVLHQIKNSEKHMSIDSIKDFRELTALKIHAHDTGLVMLGGGVPKNFAQDIVVAADLMNKAVPMHKYAIQITVADMRDGALSGSTLQEACSWGKVAMSFEQMVYSEVTIAMPLIASYAYHSQIWQTRKAHEYNCIFR